MSWNCYSWKILSSRHKPWEKGPEGSQSVPNLLGKGPSRMMLDEPGPHVPPFNLTTSVRLPVLLPNFAACLQSVLLIVPVR